jgi:hypothetical protein
MKTKTIGLTLAICFLAGVACFAADPQMGSWKLNEAKSKIAPESPKITMVVYEAVGDQVKVTVDGIAPDGKATHSEWTGKFDGKDYPVTGSLDSDTRSYKKSGERTMIATNKKGGKVTSTARIVVAADGKSRTVTFSGTTAEGKKFKSTYVQDKE